MALRDQINKHRIFLLHLSFWLLYFSYRIYDINGYVGYRNAFIYTSVPLFFNLVVCYMHYFFILPKWFGDKKLGTYFLRLALLLIPLITLRVFTENEIFDQISTNEDYYKTIRFSRFVHTFWDTASFLVFTGMIRFVLDWFDLESKKQKLENEKLVAELNYLKSQINPHFLFNTLHNLNYLVYAGSKNATEVIIKLSNIMRYMIYESGKDYVPLSSEIDYMNDYIHLESIRLNQSFQLDFNINGPVEQTRIAPLMLITFLENAFKHGVSDQETNCWIKVTLIISESKLIYQVSNKKIKVNNPTKLKSGFGLDNVKKRLELSYPSRYDLKVEEDDQMYQINLTLDLK